MRKLTVFAKAFGLVAAMLVPAALAILQLGLGLSAVDRMHARQANRPSANLESVGHYEMDGLHFRTVVVRR
jgi:hypothetical protein